ncbi:hypothetical protein JCGZ_25868 [Jatropha curcas]|uniref:Uncharacterized protein n=1 Tax=Jatropha curcas TaxID=180498 RepID=A0A067JJT5_JATCU|nr:uncharacterized protein LOC105647053 [Jatropha curcas]KDP24211.1 hypothetical protein JCGZ_25868 [Jatropha curcas]
MVSEDFSFPKISNFPLNPHFSFSSPSLWRISSLVYPDFCDQLLDDGVDNRNRSSSEAADADLMINSRRKSFLLSSCYEEKDELSVSNSKGDQEKMDMLWEDFNEELQRVSSFGNNNNNKKQMQPFNSSKKPNFFLLVKLFKKILLLQRSPRIKKNH